MPNFLGDVGLFTVGSLVLAMARFTQASKGIILFNEGGIVLKLSTELFQQL